MRKCEPSIRTTLLKSAALFGCFALTLLFCCPIPAFA